MAGRKNQNPPSDSPDVLRLEYVPLATATAWERNPKKHDAGAIWQSIQQHGFKDPPKFEPRLNGGRGGLVEGNGRSHVLAEMQAAGEEPPRGVLKNENDWLIPVLFGVDAASERAAESYGVDHNNLVMAGGDFREFDLAKLWEGSAYTELLADLAQFEALPVSVDGDDVDVLIKSLASDSDSGSSALSGNSSSGSTFEQTQRVTKSSPGVPPNERYKEQYGVIVICQGESHQAEVYQRLRDEGYDVKVVTT